MSATSKSKKAEESKKELIKTLILIAIVIGGTFGGFYLLKFAMGTEMPIVVVSSGSMEPQIHKGDILFVKHVDAEDIKNGTHEDLQGDVIIYESTGLWDDPADAPVVHRVINKFQVEGVWYFNVQGDANSRPDEPNYGADIVDIPESAIYGVVCGRIPYVGWAKIVLTEYNLAIPLMVILGLLLVISIAYDISHPEDEEESEKSQKPKNSKKKVSDEQNETKPSKTDYDFDFGV